MLKEIVKEILYLVRCLVERGKNMKKNAYDVSMDLYRKSPMIHGLLTGVGIGAILMAGLKLLDVAITGRTAGSICNNLTKNATISEDGKSFIFPINSGKEDAKDK